MQQPELPLTMRAGDTVGVYDLRKGASFIAMTIGGLSTDGSVEHGHAWRLAASWNVCRLHQMDDLVSGEVLVVRKAALQRLAALLIDMTQCNDMATLRQTATKALLEM